MIDLIYCLSESSAYFHGHTKIIARKVLSITLLAFQGYNDGYNRLDYALIFIANHFLQLSIMCSIYVYL
jgi:hypothetical protein